MGAVVHHTIGAGVVSLAGAARAVFAVSRSTGSCHNYQQESRINGHLAFWVTVLVSLAGWPVWDEPSGTVQFAGFPHWSLMYEHFAELAFVTTLLCFVVNTWLYLDSFRPAPARAGGGPRVLAAGGNSGNVCYDFFMGRELNPRIGRSFDWKEFCELRPGLMG
jgi:Delta14-sterol reductase